MARREYPIRRQCAHEGCTEWSNYYATTQREARERSDYYRKYPFRCTRHTNPEQVLSLENRSVMYDCTSQVELSKYDGKPIGTYWDRSGFVFGPGFKAYAKDFPPGTRLVITASVVLPDDYEAPSAQQPVSRFSTDSQDLDNA